jgi:hypothetical protein
VLRRFLDSDLRELRILSRDEKKQDDMRKRYNHPKLKFYIGDVPDGRDLNYAKFVEVGEQRIAQSLHGEDYNSHNTTRLDVEGMKALLLKLDCMQRIARGERAVAEE